MVRICFAVGRQGRTKLARESFSVRLTFTFENIFATFAVTNADRLHLFLLEQGPSENDARSDLYDRSAFKSISSSDLLNITNITSSVGVTFGRQA